MKNIEKADVQNK